MRNIFDTSDLVLLQVNKKHYHILSNKIRHKYIKSDVWLTVHRNSVWIRKTN